MEWVKVSDRLPEISTNIIIYSERRGVEIGHLSYDYESWWTKTGASFQYKQYKEVTHWTPLPPKPKEKNNEHN